MTITARTPGTDELAAVGAALRDWQVEGTPMQLHPGDLGWLWRFGMQTTADAVRTWIRDGEIVAAGMLDGPALLRLTLAPDARSDRDLAERIADDLGESGSVFGAGEAFLEAPMDAVLRHVLRARGWVDDEPWTPLRYDLARPVPDPGMRIEVVGPECAPQRVEVQRAAFENSSFTFDRWQAMAGGFLYADARCLLAIDDAGTAVAAVTVWSAGAGRPGLLEPMGVHREYRGRGYGTAMNRAAATALRELGASSALVCTPSANVGGVAAYVSAGFRPLPEVRDLRRTA